MDTLYHCLLIAGRFAAAYPIIVYLPWQWSAFIAAADFIYEREVIQDQIKHYDGDFRKGWNPFRWSAKKNAETWIPIAALLFAVLVLELRAAV